MDAVQRLSKPFTCILIMPSSKINTTYFREWKDKDKNLQSKRTHFQKLVFW